MLAAIQDNAADVELRKKRKQRGQVKMIVRVNVRVVQVRAVKDRNPRRPVLGVQGRSMDGNQERQNTAGRGIEILLDKSSRLGAKSRS